MNRHDKQMKTEILKMHNELLQNTETSENKTEKQMKRKREITNGSSMTRKRNNENNNFFFNSQFPNPGYYCRISNHPQPNTAKSAWPHYRTIG